MALVAAAVSTRAAAEYLRDPPPDLPKGRAGLVANTSKQSLTVDERTRSYWLHVPDAVNKPAALVLSFHGNGGNARGQERLSGFSQLADSDGFIVAYPQATSEEWRVYSEQVDDMGFIDALISDVSARYAIDSKRIYANGISLGAQFSWRLACERPKIFAAAGLVSGGYPGICNLPRIPIIVFHGTKDPILPYQGIATLMPVRDFAWGWAARDTCRLASEGEIIFHQGDATGERWSCDPEGEVVLYTLDGKGHSWPGSDRSPRITSNDIDATAAMWAFFKTHAKGGNN